MTYPPDPSQLSTDEKRELLKRLLLENAGRMPAAASASNGTAANGEAAALGRTIVESVGVYLPAREVSTQEVLNGCKARITFPLEQMTGIRRRRFVGEDEFSIDLAAKALADCLGRSAHSPADIDLLICCNISRCDGPDFRFTYEPTTAARLRHQFGFTNALAFDVANACAGTFTAIAVADAFLQTGLARHAAVVSGEYISHLTRTAQLEIESFLDPRMACLTLGDSGVALVLERSRTPGAGFAALELFTLGKYSGLCVAKATDRPHGGAIMYTDAVRSAAVTIGRAVGHALDVLRRHGWPPQSVDHLLMHQTSETTIHGAMREINRALGQPFCHPGNTICHLGERGNTATNSHFLALADHLRAGTVKPGARILFGVSGSGQTVGTGLYVMDDLPERLRQPRPSNGKPAPEPERPRAARRVRVEAVGTPPEDGDRPRDSVALLRQAGRACLERADFPKEAIDLIIHTGVYRSEFLSEPALAAVLAGELEINHDTPAGAPHKTFAFDLANGAAGTLTACHVAAQMIRAGKFARALLLASEVENNAEVWPEALVGLRETASALVLSPSDGREGFGEFVFRSFPQHLDALTAHTVAHHGRPALDYRRDPALGERYLECMAEVVGEALARDAVRLADVKMIFPSQVSADFTRRLADRLRLPGERIAPVADGTRDYFTSSLAYGLAAARARGLVRPGDLGLIVEAGAGVQAGGVLYYF